MKLPEIRISYAWLIDPVYRAAFRSDPGNKEEVRRRLAPLQR